MQHRTHYCIFCGSEGDYGSRCERHGFFRGQSKLRPNWTMQREGSWMGQRLAYVGWPLPEDPNAPYIPAHAPWPRKSSFPPREYAQFVK